MGDCAVERPNLAMNVVDLVGWVCAQGKFYRDIFVLYCVRNLRCVTVQIHVTKGHWFLRVCDMHQYA